MTKQNASIAICAISNVNQIIRRKRRNLYTGGRVGANAPEIREHSSSGGAAFAIELAFVKKGGVVCSCAFENGEFTFSFAENAEQLRKFVGSKYVKSNPKDIYKKIWELLIVGRKVLFVGLPCQVAAVKNFVGEQLQKKLYLVDLICHGSPSPKVLDIFLRQYGLQLKDLHEISFRTKTIFQTNVNTKYLTTLGTRDCYTIAFLNGLCYTENCYQCHYAAVERVSDVTLGDSWGSEMEDMAQKKGISLILCQTEKGCSLVEDAELILCDVDINRAIEHNHQLRVSSNIPHQRENFFVMLQKGDPFNTAVRKCYPKQYMKQCIKGILIKLRIIGSVK